MKKNAWGAMLLALLLLFTIVACDEDTVDGSDETNGSSTGAVVDGGSESVSDTDENTSPILCEKHTFGDWETVLQATCGANGKRERICEVCGHTETGAIPMQGEHIYMDTGKCKICSKAMDKDFLFTLNDDGISYSFNYDGNASSVTVPSTYNELPVTKLSEYAFWWCNELKTVKLPDSIVEIGAYAFDSCPSLTSVNTPESLSVIGKGAFSGCSSLTSFRIPEAVTRIEYYTFANCGLKSVNLPKTLTYVGEDAFTGCCEFTTLTIPASVMEIGEGAFSACRALKEIRIEDGTRLTHISENAFSSGASLKSVVIAEGITHLDDNAFFSNLRLNSVTLPSTVVSIGDMAFYNSADTLTVNYNGTPEEWALIEFGDKWTSGNVTVNVVYKQ
ncbi:MAG: leucine-rich repeat domain-containing protein [Clostridia bacterium]|nr:leucine-rich repeat domain-containing protein [Clostridia bacterium]